MASSLESARTPGPASTRLSAHPLPTYFAPADRSDSAQMLAELESVSHHPVLDTLLMAVRGLLAVLNEHRQVLALNEALLKVLGIADPAAFLGLRLGEAIDCVHAQDGPGGCATGEYCRNCGAAVAQVLSLERDTTVERICAIDTHRDGVAGHLFFHVRACPIHLGDRRLLLVLLQDISEQQRVATLERAFFHDLNNTLTALLGASAELEETAPEELAGDAQGVNRLVQRLNREIQLQRSISSSRFHEITANPTVVPADRLLAELLEMASRHPAAEGRQIVVTNGTAGLELQTDLTLLLRVLGNMAINALEATANGGQIRLSTHPLPGAIEFRVWNAGAIAPDTARRIFQRNFSTKGDIGRGLGTYSMRLLGEQVLGGRVSFITSSTAGTEFSLRLPC